MNTFIYKSRWQSMVTISISRSLSITDLLCNFCRCLDRNLGAVLSGNFLAILSWNLLAVLFWNFDRNLIAVFPWDLSALLRWCLDRDTLAALVGNLLTLFAISTITSTSSIST